MHLRLILMFAGCSLLPAITCLAQADTVYLDAGMKPVTARQPDGYFRVAYPRTDSGYRLRTFYAETGNLSTDGYYEDAAGKTEHGTVISYARNGRPVDTVHFIHGRRDGLVRVYRPAGPLWMEEQYTNGHLNSRKSYYTTGRLRREEVYNADTSMASGHIYDEQGNDQPFIPFELYPKFNGDLMDYLAHEVHYPNKAKKRNISGRVIIKFAIDEQGRVTDASVFQEADPMLDAEALRAVKAMPRWQPGLQDGDPVKVYYTLPVTFDLP